MFAGRLALVTLDGPDRAGDAEGSAARDDDSPDSPGDEAAAIRAAVDRLESAGTFAFAGTIERSFPDDPNPAMRGPLVDQVEGAVELPTRSIERVTPSYSDTIEHLLFGNERWSRWSFLPDEVGERPWIPEANDPYALDPRSIVEWLDASSGHQDAGTDERGRRIVRATVPARELPQEMSDGTFDVTLGDGGEPVRLALRATSQQDGTLVEAVYELSAFGEAVEIERPAADEIDHTRSVREEDIAASGVDPVGLAPPPADWRLTGGFVEVVPPGCNLLNLDYAGPNEASLRLDVTLPDCAVGPAGGEPFQAGSLSGRITGDAAASAGIVFVGDVTVVFEATGIAEPEALLAALGPIDPGEQALYIP